MRTDERLFDENQVSLFEAAEARSLIDQLIDDSKLYKTTAAYKELLDFTAKLKSFAPFNAMLLHMQKPGLSFAASAHDWITKFGRYPKEDARPLMILWPFGPVAFVYDVLDTEGDELPQDVTAFWARGNIDRSTVLKMAESLTNKRIETVFADLGDDSAGRIQLVEQVTHVNAGQKSKIIGSYKVTVNSNHTPAIQLVTIAHELGHLCLGHLGEDSEIKVPDRRGLSHEQRELEAESVAYLVAKRTGVESKSEKYLSDYVRDHKVVEAMDLYCVMRAAGQVESLLGLHRGSSFGPKPKREKELL